MTRLGKGLEALINSGPESVDKTTGITTVKVDLISPNKYQPRKMFDQKKLQELADSLKENGIIQPIIVTKRDATNYELIAGERRLEASKLAGLEEVPVIIRSVSAKEQLQFSIIENVQREDLSAIEEATAYQKLNEEFGLTHARISEIVGKDRATITNLIRLLKLPDEIQNMVLEDKLSSGHARTILQIPANAQLEFANQIVQNTYSVRKAEEEAKKIKTSGKITKAKIESLLPRKLMTAETTLKNVYHTDVKINGNQKKGKITFLYSSQEQLDDLLKKLTE